MIVQGGATSKEQYAPVQGSRTISESSKRWESQSHSHVIADRSGAEPPRRHSGAFSNVYKAQDLSTGQKVASTTESHHHPFTDFRPLYSQGRSEIRVELAAG
jgi:hypothetical protein